MQPSTALVIRQNRPKPINMIPNQGTRRNIPGHNSARNALNKLRKRTVKNTASPVAVPPVAFTVMGHGLEKPEYKIVPKGCILVVPTISGAGAKAIVSITNNLKLMEKDNRKFILDPLRYKKKLYEMFGPITIFTEGDAYPNFNYRLFGFYNSRAIQGKKLGGNLLSLLRHSGFVRINGDEPVNPHLVNTLLSDRSVFTQKYTHHQESPDIVKVRNIDDEMFDTPIHLVDGVVPDVSIYDGMNDKTIQERFKGRVLTINPKAEAIIKKLNLPELLKFSNGFTNEITNKFTSSWLEKIVTDDLEHFRETKPIDLWVKDTVGTYLDEVLADDFVVTQEELFERAGNGVYYNFICRKISENDAPANPFKLSIAEMHRISEAEIQRKRFLRNVLTGAGKKQIKILIT
jgi:hypothetical protein